MRISDWSSDVCSSDLDAGEKALIEHHVHELVHERRGRRTGGADDLFAHRIDGADIIDDAAPERDGQLLALREHRSEEHTSELQSLMRISYAVFCLKKKTQKHTQHHNPTTTKYTTQT